MKARFASHINNFVCLLGLFLVTALSASWAQAATPIYRSVGPGNTASLATGAANAMTIVGSTASFGSNLPANVGVGDAIQYDSDNNGSIDTVCFIHGRTNARTFTVRDESGSAPIAVAGDQDWSVFRAYTSLGNAESGAENIGFNVAVRDFDTWSGSQDLVTNDQQWNIACYGDNADTIPVIMSGWATDAAHYLRIFTPVTSAEVGVSQRHAGGWTPSAYRMEVSNEKALDILQDYIRIEGLQIRLLSVNSIEDSGIWVRATYGLDIRVSENVIWGVFNAAYAWHEGIGIRNGSGVVYIWNNLVYDFNGHSQTAGLVLDPGRSYYVYNNTAINCYNGIWSDLGNIGVLANNNLTQSCQVGFLNFFIAASDYNLSDLADAPGVHAKNSTTVTFVNAAADDYHLTVGDTGARDSGMDLSSDSHLAFPTDLEGDTRFGVWDIGADEYPVFPSPTQTITGTSTVTPTYSPTATPTASRTASRTASPTASRTASPTASRTASPTASPTASRTASPSASRTASPTASPSASPTASPSASPTGSSTATPTGSPTSTASSTPTVTFTCTPTQTIILSLTSTNTVTPTATLFVSSTPTPLDQGGRFATPNPFFPKLGQKVNLNLSARHAAEEFVIKIYNSKGRLMRVETDRPEWDGRNDQGVFCEGGVYIFQIEYQHQRINGTLVLLEP